MTITQQDIGHRLILAWPDHTREIDLLIKQNPFIRRIYLMGTEYPNHPIVKSLALDDELSPYFQNDYTYFSEGRVNVHFGKQRLRKAPDQCQALQTQLLRFTQQHLSGVALRCTRGWHILANEICNLHLIKNSLEQLTDIWKDEPVLIVGAGPSLDDTAPIIKKYRERFRVISCDGAWHTLAKHLIIPDLIVTADDSHKVWHYFNNLPKEQHQVPVVAMLQSCCHIVRHHKAPIYFARNGRIRDQILHDKFNLNLPAMNPGLCVGHMAYRTALHTGTSAIIMTGFDLGYKNGRFHPTDQPNPYYEKEPPPKENLLNVPANEGAQIKTELSMDFYRHEFEQIISTARHPTINATAGGARINGTSYKQLEKVAQKLPVLTKKQMPAKVVQQPDICKYLSNIKKPVAYDLVQEALNPAEEVGIRLLQEDAKNGIPGAIEALSQRQPSYDQTRALYLQIIKRLAKLQWPRPYTKQALSFSPINPKQQNLNIIHVDIDPNNLPLLWETIEKNRIDTIIMENGNILPAAWSLPGLNCIHLITDPKLDIMSEHYVPGYAECMTR